MLKITEIVEIIKCRSDIYKKYNVDYFAVFGSVSRGDDNDNSDIDILVSFNKVIGLGFIDLADELESILKNKVDLVSKNGIKPMYFEQIRNELVYV